MFELFKQTNRNQEKKEQNIHSYTYHKDVLLFTNANFQASRTTNRILQNRFKIKKKLIIKKYC